MTDVVKILVVDDSAFNRRSITKMLESDPGLQVVGYAVNGEEGLRKVFDLKPDLVTLDLEMPRLDGFSFLRILMQKRPTPVIVVSSRAGSDDVFKALEFGAVDFVAKPSMQISPELFNIRENLLQKIRNAAATDMRKVLVRAAAKPRMPEPGGRVIPKDTATATRQIVIGASTGGPPALQKVLSAFPERFPVGIAIAQHMPAGFTRAFAERLNRLTPFEVREAEDGDEMRAGVVLVAPGGKNMLLCRRGGRVVASIREPEAAQRYIPSVDVLFRSAAEVFGADLVSAVLTGMGNDGSIGVRAVRQHGGQVVAESESTSVVFGMPKEAIATGCVDDVVDLELIGQTLMRRSNC